MLRIHLLALRSRMAAIRLLGSHLAASANTVDTAARRLGWTDEGQVAGKFRDGLRVACRLPEPEKSETWGKASEVSEVSEVSEANQAREHSPW